MAGALHAEVGISRGTVMRVAEQLGYGTESVGGSSRTTSTSVRRPGRPRPKRRESLS